MGEAAELFVAALDACERYAATQEALSAALRQGFLALAQARYAMGADRVSPLQFPSHMHATAQIARAEAAGSGEGSVESQLASLRLAADQATSILSDLTAKYCSSEAPRSSEAEAEAAAGDAGDEASADQRPLHWFGALVSPALREAERHFCAALQLTVEAANVQRELRGQLDAYRSAQAGQVAQEQQKQEQHEQQREQQQSRCGG
eukprot:scaffold11.g3949.t1